MVQQPTILSISKKTEFFKCNLNLWFSLVELLLHYSSPILTANYGTQRFELDGPEQSSC